MSISAGYWGLVRTTHRLAGQEFQMNPSMAPEPCSRLQSLVDRRDDRW